MTAFPKPALDYWRHTFAADPPTTESDLALAVSARLGTKRPVMILTTADEVTRAVVSPDVAEAIGVVDAAEMSVDDLKARLEQAGISLHDPDYLFYLPGDARPNPDQSATARRLTEADRTVFDAFYNAAPVQDREDAWVELDHWAVFGCFEGKRLVSAASMNLWSDDCIADLGVLTLPDARGRGFARAVVQSINGFSREQGYEPQYRCQLDNRASIALAGSCGLMLFGQWVVADELPRTWSTCAASHGSAIR